MTIPDWFDPNLKGELARKASKKKDVGYFLDVAIYTVLDFFSSAAWKRLRKYGWDELEEVIRKDCEEIEKSGFSPDVIVGIKSGGAFLAKFVAQCLGVKDVDYVSTEHWAPVLGSTVIAFFLKSFRKARLIERCSIDLKSKKILLFDDQIFTGSSLQIAKEWIIEQGAKEVRTYCVFHQFNQTDLGKRKGLMMNSPWGFDP